MPDYFERSMLEHARELFPICRSLTGEGTRKTLAYFETYHPELTRLTFSSGEAVYDWEIPNEWNIRDAYILHLKTGRKYAEFKKNNLHVVGYSEPCDLIVERDQLLDRIHSLPEHPKWIPYVTSYYSRSWGFCMAHEERRCLPSGKYRVVIDSRLEPGTLELSHAVIAGTLKREIFFSSYVCHPSMANNEVSGPVLLAAIMQYVKTSYPSPKFSYRFVLLPETIGSIAYLSRFAEQMKKTIIAGFNLSCVGDDRGFTHLQSPYNDTLADKALLTALAGLDNLQSYSFLDRGSDERQYCSPTINLPVCGFSRTLFTKYPEYHTSGDDFSVVTEEGLHGSYLVMKDLIDAFETGLYPIVKCACEPQLGKRGLFGSIGDQHEAKVVKARLDILAYCNGRNTIFEIATLSGQHLKNVIREVALLKCHGLVEDGDQYTEQNE